jgi:hypothetical protein
MLIRWQKYKKMTNIFLLGNCKLKHLYTPIRISKFQNTDNIKSWQGCRSVRILIYCFWAGKMVELLWKTVAFFHYKTKCMVIILSSNQVLCGLFAKWVENYTKTCIQMFIAASFIHDSQYMEATKMCFDVWKQISLEIHTMQYYSALKRNEQLRHRKTWRNL